MKVVSAREAVREIKSGSTLGVSGFRWAGCSEALFKGLHDEFRATQQPRDLTLMFSSAPGDNVSTGLAWIAQRGLLKRVIGGFWGVTPQLMKLAVDEEIEAYNLPQGQIARLYGAIAAGQPGLVTEIGLETYIDPRLEGGRINRRTPADLIEVVQLRGRDYLLYQSHPIHAAFIRGTVADCSGNVSVEEEAALVESLPLACAAHNSGGKVFVQVKRLVPDGQISPQRVEIPGHLVDYVVVAGDVETDHRQTVRSSFDRSLVGQGDPAEVITPSELAGERLIIASRAALELKPGDVVNLGQGIPSSIPQALAGHPLATSICFTLESGVIGGIPHPVPDFGVASHPTAMVRMDDQFMFYDGGGLDVAFLGFAEVDAEGNVNVSKFGGRFIGCGGFMDIAQPAKRLVFCGGFRAGKLDARVAGNRVTLQHSGQSPKFVGQIQQKTFSGPYAWRHGQKVTYVTERCVFELGERGLILTEVADGIDVERDILAQMDFRPQLASPLRVMKVAIPNS